MNPINLLQVLSYADQATHRQQGLNGIAPLDTYVYAGTVIEWNGQLWLSDGTSVQDPSWSNSNEIAANIDAGLWGGWFSSVEVRSAGLGTLYFTILVTTATDFAKLGDVLSVIEGAIWDTSAAGFSHLAFKTIDLRVVSVPAISVNTPGAAKPSPTPTGQLPSGVTPANADQYAKALCAAGQYHSDLCGCGKAWNWLPPGCYAADANGETNVTGWTTTAIALGAIGALLAVVLINKVAK